MPPEDRKPAGVFNGYCGSFGGALQSTPVAAPRGKRRQRRTTKSGRRPLHEQDSSAQRINSARKSLTLV
jgi:hypothetical protein